MVARRQHKPSPSVAEAIALLTSELARLQRIDTGESVPEALGLARAELADEKREHRRSIDAYDRMRGERDAIVEQRDRIRGERDAAHAKPAALESKPAAQTIELRELAEARQTIANLRADLARERGDSVPSTLGSIADDHALCWRALRDALVSICGATQAEGEGERSRTIGAPDHPLESIAEAVLRASEGAASLGALSASQIIAAELHALSRDAVAWRRFRDACAGDLQKNDSKRDAIAATVYHAIDRVELGQRREDRDRQHGPADRRALAPWVAWDAVELGAALATAAERGIVEAQATADEDANAAEAAAEAAENGPDPHAEWWRTFVATASGSPSRLDGDASRLARAMRRGGLPVTSTDDSIETVEACAEMIGAVLDRMVTHAA